MYRLFNKIIDIWLKNIDNKIKLAYSTGTTLPTVYKTINKDGYNLTVINQMWVDIQDYLTDEDKLEMIIMLGLL